MCSLCAIKITTSASIAITLHILLFFDLNLQPILYLKQKSETNYTHVIQMQLQNRRKIKRAFTSNHGTFQRTTRSEFQTAAYI